MVVSPTEAVTLRGSFSIGPKDLKALHAHGWPKLTVVRVRMH
jgi:hypothetical protein